MSTPTTAAPETMTPAARAEEIAREGGKAWAAEMFRQCRSAEQRADLIENTTLETLGTQSFAALKGELRAAGLAGEWSERENALCRIECEAALEALAEAAEKA